MMGIKVREFAPLPDLSLEELVPKDNFYRRLEEELDLSFVRDLVRDFYAASGRPSVDPQVFFKLELVLFFEDLRSERQLMEVVAGRLSPYLTAHLKRFGDYLLDPEVGLPLEAPDLPELSED